MAGVPGDELRCAGDWVLGAQLGAGSFAVVWKAHHRATGQVAAVKEINLARLNAKLRQSLESEVSILRRVSHPNVVQLLDVLETRGRLFLIMEFCAGGDLAQLLRAVGSLAEGTARRLMRELAAGLREMWTHHLVHRDLKPQNLLLSDPGPSGTLKIADFGFARALGPQLLAETLCGSPLYMAPEILLSQRYDAKADLWSVGAILYEVLAGAPPYTGTNQVALLRAIRAREARLPPDLAAGLSPSCALLVHSLLRRNPVERISFEEFFSHPFLTAEPPGGVAPPPSIEPPPWTPQEQRERRLEQPPGGGADTASGLTRSNSAGGLPHHVVGFVGQGLDDRRGLAGRLPPPAAVPVGQLTEQLRSRGGSMEFDARGRAAAAAAAAAHQGRLVGSRGPPVPAQQRRRQALAAAKGPSTVAEAVRLARSAHSDDSDYVLVDTEEAASKAEAAASAAAAAASAASPKPSPGPVVRREADVHAAHAAHEAFLLHAAPDGDAAHPGGSGSDASSSAAALLAGSVPWQGASRRQFLHLVAAMIHDLAEAGSGTPPPPPPPEHGAHTGGGGGATALACRLSFHLAALQLYDLALEAPEAAHHGGGGPARASSDGSGSDAGSGSSSGSGGALVDGSGGGGVDASALRAEALAALRQAEAVAEALEAAAAAGPHAAASAELPNPWEACHQVALRWARDAASDELLGNYLRSERAYARAGALLHFLAAEARGLGLQPPALLAAEDEARLQRCASAAAARWAACAALAAAERAAAS